jgi:hypothetical protein
VVLFVGSGFVESNNFRDSLYLCKWFVMILGLSREVLSFTRSLYAVWVLTRVQVTLRYHKIRWLCAVAVFEREFFRMRPKY